MPSLRRTAPVIPARIGIHRHKKDLLDKLRAEGKLQGDGTAAIAATRHVGAAAAAAQAPAQIARACAVCFKEHNGGTASCPYLQGCQELVQDDGDPH